MSGMRDALLVATGTYEDEGLRRLRAPAQDADALAKVLGDPTIGDFQVHRVVDQPHFVIAREIQLFFDRRGLDDLLVLHLSCHGLKDDDGRLFFAGTNTEVGLLDATAVSSEYVRRVMDRCRARSIVLLVDCCYSGAVLIGAKGDRGVHLKEKLAGEGRAILTASNDVEYAWEGEDWSGQGQPSLFTAALVEGLRTGAADRDGDGEVSVDELYNYVYERLLQARRGQTPLRWSLIHGAVYIAHVPQLGPPATRELPKLELSESVIDFGRLVQGSPPPRRTVVLGNVGGGALNARATSTAGWLGLKQTEDELLVTAETTVAGTYDAVVSVVSDGGAATIRVLMHIEPRPILEPSDSVIDFGRLIQGNRSTQRRVRLGNAGAGALNARATTSADWVRLKQSGDVLVVTVDTVAPGEREATISVESDGGSASILVRVLIAARAEPHERHRERKPLRHFGPVALMFASVGSIIGSGWLLSALVAANVAGPAALISWLIGAAMVLPLALIHAELGGMFPVSGGSGSYPHYAFGTLAGFASGWIWYLGAVTVAPAEVEAALIYANNYLPGLINTGDGTLTVPLGFILAAVLMAVFSAINVLGVRWLAETNKWTVWWKIAIPVLTVIVFLALFHHFDNLTSHGFMPNGLAAVFAALSSGIIYAFLGFEQAVEFGAESKNPQRNIPFAVIGSIVIGVVIYLGVAIAFTTGLAPSALANGWSRLRFPGSFGPYAAIASANGLGLLAILLYSDAVISPAGTGLLYVGSSARMSFGMARNRYIPAIFEELSARRVPLVGILIAFVLGFLCLLPFPSWQTLIGIITSATVLSYGLQPLALTALRRQVPFLDRPYRLPAAEVISPIAFVIANWIIYWSGWSAVWPLMLAVAVGFLILGLYNAFASLKQRTNYGWRTAYWLMPYLGGLMLISWLGATDYGGRGLFPFGWDAIVMAVFSLIIYRAAIALRLPADEVKKVVGEVASAVDTATDFGARRRG